MTELHCKYQLANTAGYKFNIVKIGHHEYDPLAYYHKDNFPDVEITRPQIETDLTLLHTKCLMTVNGYIYPTTLIDNHLYIPNATVSMVKSRSNQIGILSFNTLDQALTKIALTPDMIQVEAPFSLYEKAVITFPVEIQHPILIIAGYMIFEDPEFFYRTSDTTFVLRLEKLLYIEKLYELQRYRSIFDELDIPVSQNDPSMIDGVVARSDATIIKFLTLFNSFMVNLPITTLNRRKIYLEHSNIPGNFRTELEPQLPVIVGYGKLAEYFKKKTTDSKYTVYINDAYYNNFLFSNLNYNEIKVYNDHREVGNTYRLSQAFFLDLSFTG